MPCWMASGFFDVNRDVYNPPPRIHPCQVVSKPTLVPNLTFPLLALWAGLAKHLSGHIQGGAFASCRPASIGLPHARCFFLQLRTMR